MNFGRLGGGVLVTTFSSLPTVHIKESGQMKQKENAANGVGTLQGMVERFRKHAKFMGNMASRFTNLSNTDKLFDLTAKGTRNFYLGKVRRMRILVKKHFNKDLPNAPKLPANDYCAGMIYLAEWFDDCAAILEGNVVKTKEPTIQPRFRLAQQAYEETLELAKENSIIFTGDREEMWRYATDHLQTDYKVPSFKAWINYLDGYIRESEAAKKYYKSL